MAQKVFVTGGSGFVGKNVIPQLLAAGHQVVGIGRSERSRAAVAATGAEARPGDLTDAASLQAAMQGCDAVLHIAAHMDFAGDSPLYEQINVKGTQALLAAAKATGIGRFVYVSAAAVVAGPAPVVNATEAYVPRKMTNAPYPVTKLRAEELVLAANGKGMTTLALRPPLIWGPQNGTMEAFTENIKKGQWMWINGGRHTLSTVHVNNLGAAMLAALEKGRGGEAYYVVDEGTPNLKAFLSDVIGAFGLKAPDRKLSRGLAYAMAGMVDGLWKWLPLKAQPPISRLMVQLMGQEFSVRDTKARELLGYRPVKTIAEGMAELRAYNQAHGLAG